MVERDTMPLQKERILIVDDEAANIDILASFLKEHYALSVAKSGEQALQRARSDQRPDLILLDVLMPGMSGFGVLTELKADERTKDIPVIFVTGLNEAGDEESGLELGAVDYITKPVSPPIVKARVRTQLRLKRSQERIRRLFGRFVDPRVVDQMLRRDDDRMLAPDERPLTVLFSDIVGFTSIAEKLPADKMFELLSGYLESMTQEVVSNRGTLDKYIGDAVMAFWNAPVAMPDHAQLAVGAALRMRQRIDADPVLKEHGIDCRIGIATGNIAVGTIGSSLRADYTVIGDTVNLASRLEGANKQFDTKILVSENTAAELDNKFLLRTIGRVKVKGKETSIRVFEVLDFADQQRPDWLDPFENAYKSLEAGDSHAAVVALAGVLVQRNDRVIRALLDRALEMRDSPNKAIDLSFDISATK